MAGQAVIVPGTRQMRAYDIAPNDVLVSLNGYPSRVTKVVYEGQYLRIKTDGRPEKRYHHKTFVLVKAR